MPSNSTDENALDSLLNTPDVSDDKESMNFDVWTDTAPLVWNKFKRGKDITLSSYHSTGLAGNLLMSDEDELEALKNFDIREDESYKSAPWAIRALSDASEMLPGIGATVGTGFVGSQAAMQAAAPLAAGASRVPFYGPALALAIEADAGAVGFMAGNIQSIATQSYGEIYRELRLNGASRNTSRSVATVYGGLNAGLEYVGFKTLSKIAGKAMTQGQKEVLRKSLKNKRFSQVRDNAFARFGVDYLENLAVEPSTEAVQTFNENLAKMTAAYIERSEVPNFEDWGQAMEDSKQSFLTTLGASIFLGAGSGAVGYATGTAKETGKKLTPDEMKEAMQALEGKTLNEITSNMIEAMDAMEVDKSGEQLNFVENEDGNVTLHITAQKTSKEGGPQSEEKTETEETEQTVPTEIADAIETALEEGQIDESAESVDKAQIKIERENEKPTAAGLEGTALGELAEAVASETPEALDALFPNSFGFEFSEPGTIEDARQVSATEELTDLTPQEAQSRMNQISSDLRVLRVNQKRLEDEFRVKDATGKSTNAVLKKLEAVLEAREMLEFEQELLESGILTREDISKAQGRQRMSVLGRLMTKIEKAKNRLTREKEKGDKRAQAAETKGFKKGETAQERAIKATQRQLTQLVNSLTTNQKHRNRMKKHIAGVTQKTFNTATKKIQNELNQILKEESQKRVKAEQKKLVADIDKMLGMKKGKVRQQSGKPVSALDADTIKKLDTFRNYLKDSDKVDLDIQDFLTQHGADLASGNVANIPDEAMEQYQIATLASSMFNGDLLSLNVVRGNVAQWFKDAIDRAEKKRAALRKKRDDERELARQSVSAEKFRPNEGQESSGVLSQQFRDSLGVQILSWDQFLEFISADDPNHAIRDLLDPHEADRNFYASREFAKLGLLDAIQKHVNKLGMNIDIQKKIEQDSDTVFEISYKDQTGKIRYNEENGKKVLPRYSKAELIDIWMKMQDPDLFDTMRDVSQGNGWTLIGDTKPGESFEEIIRDILQPDDIAVAEAMFNFYDEYHQRVNAVYRRKYGADLPKKPNYSPLDRKGYDVRPVDQPGLMFRSLLPGSAKTRTNNLFRIMPRNVYDIASKHIDQWEHFINRDEFLQTVQNVTSDGKIRDAIRQRHGTQALQVMDDYVQRFVIDDAMPSDRSHPLWGALRSDMARYGLGFKSLYQGAVQLTAGMSMWRNLNPGDVVNGIAGLSTNIVATEKMFRSSSVLAHRFRSGVSFDLSAAMNRQGLIGAQLSKITGKQGSALTPEQHNAITSVMFMGIRYGDAASARIFGGVLYNAELAKGATPEEALITVEKEMQRTQQSDAVSQIPYFYASNPTLYSIVGQFTLQPLQLYGHSMIATRDAASQKKSPKAFANWAKKMMLLWSGPGALYGLIRALPALFMPPDEDPDRTWEAMKDVLGQTIMGPLNALPFIGSAIELGWFIAQGKRIRGQSDPFTETMLNAHAMWNAWEKIWDDDESLGGELEGNETSEALLKTGRTFGPLLGIPQFLTSMPITVDQALKRDDYIGALFAVAGFSHGSVKKRFDDPIEGFGDEESGTPFEDFDFQSLLNSAFAESDAHDEESDTDDDTDFEAIFNDGVANSLY